MTMKTDILDQFATLSRPVRARLAKIDSAELEQVHIRIVFAALIVLYVAWYAMTARSVYAGRLLLVLGYFGASLAIGLAVWVWPGPSLLRRTLGIVSDVSMATCGLWALGEGGVVIVCFYLFIILGNGFRYGPAYLHISQALSIAGLAFAMARAPWWEDHLVIGFGLLQMLLIIPFYISVLAERLKAALWNAQRALEDCRRNQDGSASEHSSERSGG